MKNEKEIRDRLKRIEAGDKSRKKEVMVDGYIYPTFNRCEAEAKIETLRWVLGEFDKGEI